INPDIDDVVAPVASVSPTKKTKSKRVHAEIVEPDSDSKAVATVDPIATYLAEIRKYPLLTKEQERELALHYRETGDPRAAERLVTSNLRFVVKVAAEYSRFGAKLIDLVQEGNVGLMHAVREFNPYKGVRLITYAVWWIRGYIQEYLMRQYSMVRIGTTQNQRKLFYRLQKEKDKLEADGQRATVPLLAGRLGVSEEEVETMQQRLSGRDVSLNTPLDSGSSAATLLDFEADEHMLVDEDLGHREELEVLREHLEKIRPTLNEKETHLLDNRLLSEEPLTLQEIGDEWKVTREAVRQMEARLVAKIRKAVVAELGTDEF
ncbi:MAG TPA: RNA polymerase factor sigma-32, partial [Bdellovibrionales bacterium]|nr:RNA polymerase factor sigma-32 [Bdellovibrionales bacterium]